LAKVEIDPAPLIKPQKCKWLFLSKIIRYVHRLFVSNIRELLIVGCSFKNELFRPWRGANLALLEVGTRTSIFAIRYAVTS
jgi:hypothetical protein